VRPYADWNCFNEPAELQSIACGAGRADRELVYEIVGAGSDCAPFCSDGAAEGAASLSTPGWGSVKSAGLPGDVQSGLWCRSSKLQTGFGPARGCGLGFA